ncbi:non-ribosomal peptide synthetase [Flavobacterium chilense]|uniref:Fengycin family lipopeptide synthetase D n=1 Tax=Flavobacterium chilense TaxID=946677 RepID=A0A1M6XD08_9FLAO|nr:non-ribosomal peptide synthetase [Flavobacterium chilense]SHL03837.1 fengycin family lipopeptide synthetase D [Flavobacterium chilense]
MNKSILPNKNKLTAKYWKKKTLNKTEFNEFGQFQINVENTFIDVTEINYFNKITTNNIVAQYTVVSAICSFLLKRLLTDFDGNFTSNFMINNPLFFSFSTDLKVSFKEYLQKIKNEILETLEHSDYDTTVIRDLSQLSNYSISFNSNATIKCNGVLLDIKINELGSIQINSFYVEGFVKSNVIVDLVNYLKSFLINLQDCINVNLSEYQLLSEEEKRKVLVDFNTTDIVFPEYKTIVDLFEDQVVKTPKNTAIIFKNKELNYLELNEKANQLANYISTHYKVNKGDVIGVFLPKSDFGIISLLAILKLGAIYLPIDINYPLERINFLIQDSGLNLLINTETNTINVNNCDIISISSVELKRYNSENINTVIFPKDLAYIIYTSGSTGQPKGVMVEHQSTINMFLDQIRTFEITAKDNIIWFASVSFDASISEILMTLNSGATLCVPTEDEIKDKDQFVVFLKETQSSVVTFPPSYLGLLSEDDISGFRCIITAGEPANKDTAIHITGLGIDYYNAYGPTECTVCVSIHKVTKDDFNKSIIPIGKPISNTKVYILDEQLQPLSIGVSGKIYVSGAGLARGYLNKPELTNEKFVVNPFTDGQQMYDTGDIGCWLPDGTIEFQGRKDEQVKLRGFRIELGEIENTILQYSKDLKQVVVEVKENNQEKVLIAYLVSNTIVDKSDLRSFLQSRLPDYMVPGFYVPLEKLPLTPNGKIDKKSLPELSGRDIIRKQYVAPRNKVEETLAEIWHEVLNIEAIGIHDDFFELGGHSLIVGQVINRINQQLGKTISFKTFFSNATIEKVTMHLKEGSYLPILKAPEAASYPLTASQNRLWILSQLEGGSLAYNMPGAVYLKGGFDTGKFEESFKILISRHEILRTNFKINDEGEVRQYVLPANKVNFKILNEDYSLIENQDDAIRNYLLKKNKEIFDLEKDSLLRASLIHVNKEEYVFFLSLHHIIGDGWTIELIIAEIVKIYNTLKQGKVVNSAALKIQYKDYAVWLQNESYLEGIKKSEEYWLNQFAGEIPVLDIPGFKTRPLVQTYNGNTITHTFGKEFLDQLKSFSQQYDVTLFMTLMSGVNALLHRYTGQHDIIVGTPIAGREHPDLENQIGLFLNTLVIRTQVKEQSTFLDLIVNQKEKLLEAYDHQNYPFDLLVSKLNLKRDTSRSTLFDVLVVLQNQTQLKNINTEELSDIEISNFNFNDQTAQVDISFRFVETDLLHLAIEYNTDIYEGYLIEKMFSHFECLLVKSLENPLRAIEQIDFLTEKEKQQLLFDFNNTEVLYPKGKTIVDLFEEQVSNTPDHIAVIFNETTLTYRELNEQSNQLAAYLIENYTIESNDLVGIKLDRSERMIISIFGILKSGGAYVPIDVNYPQERVDYIAKDASLKLCIDENEWVKFKLNQNSYPTTSIQLSQLDHLAYCIYTSGSTGNPKGVLNHHAGLYNRLLWMKAYLQVNDKQVFLQKTPYTFDVSVWELILPFITGSSLIVAKPDGHKEVLYLQEVIDKEQVTIIHFVPSMLGSFLENVEKGKGSSLRHIICSGEELTVSTAQRSKERFSGVALHNFYGPTEAAIDVTAIDLSEVEVIREGVSIGKPIANTKIYIVNDSLELQPFGVPGELLISGIQVARGYLNLSELTENRFIADPFRKGYHVYRTGDIAKWQSDGSIQYLGRIDNQVKIRGNRIELGEVENAITMFKAVQQVVVVAKELNSEKVLVAYIVAENVLDKTELRSFLQGRLPEFMVPGFYIQLTQLPLSSNGKIDRKKLPEISSKDIVRKVYVAPVSTIEKELVSIWQDVLGLENIGITDNFFELGGHSLIIAQVINRTQKQLGSTVNYKDFFSNPTILGLSKALESNHYVAIPAIPESTSYPLTPSQNRLWVLSQLEGGELAYNMPAAVKLKGAVDANKFQEAFLKLIARHEILRTSFKINHEGEISQFIVPAEQVKFKIENKDFLLKVDKEQILEEYLKEENNKIFDLEQAPLIRASIIRLEDNEFLFFLSLHHIIGDGWSIEVLISELIKIYNALTQAKEINLPELKIQYKDYAVWLQESAAQENHKIAEQYWLNQFQGELPILDLPSFKPRPLLQNYNGNNITHQYSNDFLEKLKAFSVEQDVTLFMTLITGINALLHLYTGQNDIIVGTPIAGREHSDLENQIGLYLNTLAIRTIFNENISFSGLLKKQKETLLDAYQHQSYPFDELTEKLNLKRDNSRSALFDVLIVLQNQSQLNNVSNETLSDLEVSDYKISRKSSQFDMSFTFVETTGLDLTIEYNTDIYDAYLIERMFSHFEKLLTESLAQPESVIQKTTYLKEEEKQQLLVDFNNTTAIYSQEKTIVALFEEQIVKNPDNIAVLFQETELTYTDLNERANQLAYYLRENYDIQADDFVGIKLERSEKMIISILGILKSGAAYIPIDINYPQERIDYIEDDSNSKLIIDVSEFERFSQVQDNYLKSNIQKINTSKDLAYVIYTSGTTGNPKGVMVENRNVINLITHQSAAFGITSTENILQFSNISFDASVEQIFLALLNGALLSIPDNDTILNAEKLEAFIDVQKITHLHTVPSLLENISPKKFPFLKRVISGGDICSLTLANSWCEHCNFYNEYGPTETTVTSIELLHNKGKDFSIGRPISNTQVYIVNELLQPVAIGVTGKIFIGGDGITRGYLNKPELTRDKFISNPYREGSLMYDTGDLGKWLPDGNIQFSGRKDQQVKLRGYRIELGEIETAITQFSNDLKQVIVELKETKSDKFLISYIVSNEDIDIPKLKQFLQEKLPNYMIPGFYITLDHFPLTPNGKIDRKALPGILDENVIKKTYIAPRNETEKKLVELWQQVLEVENIGVLDDFFELGGHSLKAMKLIGLITNEFEIKIAINDLFKNIILEEQATLIENINSMYVHDIENDESDVETEIFSI